MSNEPVELSVLLENARRLQAYTKPVCESAEIAKKIYRWEDPVVNVTVLAAVNFTCFLLPAGFFLLLLLVLIGLMATLGIIYQYNTSWADQQEQNGGELVRGHNETNSMSHEDLMHEYVNWLCQMNSVIINIRKVFHFIKKMLLCTYRNEAIRFYLSLTVMSISICLLTPIQCFAVLVNILLLDHKLQKAVAALLDHISKMNHTNPQSLVVQTHGNEHHDTESTHIERNGVALVEDKSHPDTKGPDLDSKDETKPQISALNGDIPVASGKEDMSTNSPDTDSSSEVSRSELSPSRTTAVVNKIVEFKKKHTNSLGTCTNCGVQFTSILKRRHLCSKCGHAFCGRCCSNKVAKSTLGVTAPSAKTEMVATCQPCYLELTASKET